MATDGQVKKHSSTLGGALRQGYTIFPAKFVTPLKTVYLISF